MRKLKILSVKLDRKIIVIISVIVLLVAVIVLGKSGILNFGGKAEVITYTSDSKTGYRAYDDGYIQYTKDGAKFFTKTGVQAWSDSYVMTSPIIAEKGDYTAVFETGGRSAKVYNDKGTVCSIQTSDAILSVSVGENGYTGIITNGDTYSVSVYSTSGSLIFQRIEADTGVYPFCCDISSSGDIIAIAYVDTSGVEVNSKIGMFYIDSEKGSEFTDSMFAAAERKDEVIFGVYFVSKGGLIAVGDRSISFISSSGTEDWKLDVTNEITGIGLCGNKVAMVYGDELADKEGLECGTVVYITSSGKLQVGHCIGAESEFFVSSSGGIVVGSGTNYYGINLSGKLVWSINDTGSLNGIYPTSDVKNCVYATKTWSVEADMSNFDSSDYIIRNDDHETGEVETVADEITNNDNSQENNVQNTDDTKNDAENNAENNENLNNTRS